MVFQGLKIVKTLLGSGKGFFRIQRVAWVLGAWVMGSGVLGAQVLGANCGVLVFKLWGLCPKCTCWIWLKFSLGDQKWVH